MFAPRARENSRLARATPPRPGALGARRRQANRWRPFPVAPLAPCAPRSWSPLERPHSHSHSHPPPDPRQPSGNNNALRRQRLRHVPHSTKLRPRTNTNDRLEKYTRARPLVSLAPVCQPAHTWSLHLTSPVGAGSQGRRHILSTTRAHIHTRYEPSMELFSNAIIINFLLVSLAHLCPMATRGELYTSVEELARWPDIMRMLSNVLAQLIRLEETKITKLKEVHNSLLDVLQFKETSPELAAGHGQQTTNHLRYTDSMLNPIGAFVTLNRLVRAIDNIHSLLDRHQLIEDEHNNEKDTSTTRLTYLFRKLKHHLPTYDDLIGSGEALLRLQTFYDLDIDDLVHGTLPARFIWDNDNNPSKLSRQFIAQQMGADDCFELGKIAFQNEQFPLAIQWLYKSLELSSNKNDENDTRAESYEYLINDILEYMAFSAFKMGQIEYSAKLTQAWLERDPQNDRALDNLQYYLEELNEQANKSDSINDEHTFSDIEPPDNNPIKTGPVLTGDASSSYSFDERSIDLENYSLSHDQVVRRLCLSSGLVANTTKKCYKQSLLDKSPAFPEAKVEVLNLDPKVIRLHDILTHKEAAHIRQEALPKLERSTVHSGSGFQPSNFRIAKTAWISSKRDLVVERFEDRLSAILGISMDKSEDLQVVNYGLGGFYGPHLDSARPSASKTNDSVPISDLQRSDRLATILMYLNHVEAGGSTVFPKLNVTVTPIERSAVVWFNIRHNGLSDERTLHTGCPVLLGSKWIATKWPREEANSFLRPWWHREG